MAAFRAARESVSARRIGAQSPLVRRAPGAESHHQDCRRLYRDLDTASLSSSAWQDLYRLDLLGVYAPLAVTLLFLLYRLVAGRPAGGVLARGAGFVDGYAIAVGVETMVDA